MSPTEPGSWTGQDLPSESNHGESNHNSAYRARISSLGIPSARKITEELDLDGLHAICLTRGVSQVHVPQLLGFRTFVGKEKLTLS